MGDDVASNVFLAKQTGRLRSQATAVYQGEHYIQRDFPSAFRTQLLAGFRSNLYTSVPALLKSRNIGAILQTRSNLYLPPSLSKHVEQTYQLMLDHSTAKRLSFAQLTSFLEYCLMCDWVIDGCVIIPNLDVYAQPTEWHSLMIPTTGVYQGQRITYKIVLNADYPESLPMCYFVGRIPNHPLIDKESGALDLKFKFSEWNPASNCIVQVLAFVRRVFRDPQYLINLSQDGTDIKQPDFLRVTKTEGLEAAVKASSSAENITDDEVEDILDHLFLPHERDSGGKAGGRERAVLTTREIQTAVDNICDHLPPPQKSQVYRRGVHYRHDDMVGLTSEADALYDLLIGAVASSA